MSWDYCPSCRYSSAVCHRSSKQFHTPITPLKLGLLFRAPNGPMLLFGSLAGSWQIHAVAISGKFPEFNNCRFIVDYAFQVLPEPTIINLILTSNMAQWYMIPFQCMGIESNVRV